MGVVGTRKRESRRVKRDVGVLSFVILNIIRVQMKTSWDKLVLDFVFVLCKVLAYEAVLGD
jgi:hypothetical protein